MVYDPSVKEQFVFLRNADIRQRKDFIRKLISLCMRINQRFTDKKVMTEDTDKIHI